MDHWSYSIFKDFAVPVATIIAAFAGHAVRYAGPRKETYSSPALVPARQEMRPVIVKGPENVGTSIDRVFTSARPALGTQSAMPKITRDITERKKAEEELEKARQFSLQAQKLEAIGQLTGGIAHDFNNLLTAVLGSLELLRKRLPNDPKSTALLDNAVQGARRGTTLTKRMLAFARNYELNKEVVGIPDLVRGMTDLLQRSIGPSYNLETRFPLSLKPVDVDANQLELAP